MCNSQSYVDNLPQSNIAHAMSPGKFVIDYILAKSSVKTNNSYKTVAVLIYVKSVIHQTGSSFCHGRSRLHFKGLCRYGCPRKLSRRSKDDLSLNFC